MANPRLRLYTTVSLMLAFGAIVVNDKAIDEIHQCPTVKAMFVIDKYNSGLSFYQHRRFLRDFVDKLQEDTLLQVLNVDNKVIIKGKKKEILKDKYWLNKIGVTSSSHGIIKPSNIRDAVFNFFDIKENPDTAEHIYLLVNEKTEIDNVKMVREVMKHQKVHIVLYGTHTKGDVWTKLSVDEEDSHVLGKSSKVIIESVQAVARRSCIGKNTFETTPAFPRQDKSQSEDHFQILPIINTIGIFCLSIFVHRGKLFWVWNRLRIWLPVPAQGEETEKRIMTEQIDAVRDQIFVELKQIAETKIQTEIENHAKYMKKLCEDMQRKIEDLQSKNQISNNKIQRMDDENEILKNGLVECKESVEKLSKQNEIMQGKIEDIEAKNQISNNKIQRMDDENERLKNGIVECKESEEKLSKQNEIMQGKIEDIEAKNKISNSKMKRMDDQHIILKEEMDEFKESVTRSLIQVKSHLLKLHVGVKPCPTFQRSVSFTS